MASPSINWQERARRAEAIAERLAMDLMGQIGERQANELTLREWQVLNAAGLRTLDAWAQHVADYATLEDAQK